MALSFVICLAVLCGLALFFFHEVDGHPPRWNGVVLHVGRRESEALAAIPFLLGCITFWAFFVEPNRLVVHHETISIDGWPRELSDLRIAVISDIHAGAWFIDDKKLQLIVERTNQLQPDLIVILGDYMSGVRRTTTGWTRKCSLQLSKIFARSLGVYSVLGNHDWWFDGQRVRRALEANGIKVLDDEVVEVKTRGTSFWLAGLADLWTRLQHIEGTIAKIPQGVPIILDPQSRYFSTRSRTCAVALGWTYSWRAN